VLIREARAYIDLTLVYLSLVWLIVTCFCFGNGFIVNRNPMLFLSNYTSCY